MNGVIFDLKRFAIHDGPGIRTTVFLRGCPLRCVWCHNPESQGFGMETFAGRDGCSITVGRSVSVDEVVEEVARDVAYYTESGGGVTFSGGEPLAQPKFLMELLRRCRDLGIHCAVDTCGFASADVVLEVAELTDLFLFDVKLVGAEDHLKYTGAGVELIHSNLRLLCDSGADIQLRFPVVPGITDSEDNLDGVRELMQSLSRELPIKMLPYHSAAMDKYPRFGMRVPLPDTLEPTAEEMERCGLMLDI